MNKNEIVCRKCKTQCKEQVDSHPTYFAKYIGTELLEAICIDCWKNGESWDKDSK